MPRFLIEVPHQNTKEDCLRAISIFKTTGSHFLTHADWGCHDNVHTAWFTIEIDTKEAALSVVPPWYRSQTKVTTLHKLAMNKIDHIIKHHDDHS